jgi:hypothetical protein
MSTQKTVLIFEDNAKRIADFERTVPALGEHFALKVWRDAPSMISECEQFFSSASLISLTYGSEPKPWDTGLEVAKFLATCRPACPIIIHTSNSDRAHSMQNELRFADWNTELVSPLAENWVQTHWFETARKMVTELPNMWPATIPEDHDRRMHRALLSLDGLSVGDGFGECFFTRPEVIEHRLEHQELPPAPWFVTDDTMMALSIVRCLNRYGHVQQEALASAFAREYSREPNRG